MHHARQKGLPPLRPNQIQPLGYRAPVGVFLTPGAFFSTAVDPVKWPLPYPSELTTLVRILHWVSLWATWEQRLGMKKSRTRPPPHTAYSLDSPFLCVTRCLEHSKCSSMLAIIKDVRYFTYITWLILSTRVWDRYYHYSHLTDGETKVVVLGQDHRGGARSQTKVSPTPSPYFYTLHGFAILTYLIALLNLVRWAAGIFSLFCRWENQGLLSSRPKVEMLLNSFTKILPLIQRGSHSVDSFLFCICGKSSRGW